MVHLCPGNAAPHRGPRQGAEAGMGPGLAGSHGMMRTPQPLQPWVGVVTLQGAKRPDGKENKKAQGRRAYKSAF